MRSQAHVFYILQLAWFTVGKNFLKVYLTLTLFLKDFFHLFSSMHAEAENLRSGKTLECILFTTYAYAQYALYKHIFIFVSMLSFRISIQPCASYILIFTSHISAQAIYFLDFLKGEKLKATVKKWGLRSHAWVPLYAQIEFF